MGSGSCVTVDLAALVRNWRALGGRVAPSVCGAVVKADAYGLGAARVGAALARAGCAHFYVATCEEGVALRAVVGPEGEGISPVGGPHIYVLHGVAPGCEPLYLAHALTPVLATARDVALWSSVGEGRPCWLQVDTGMNRLGFGVDEIPDFAASPLHVVGLLSHLACADEPAQFLNVEQIKAFRAVRRRYPALKASLANSPGIFLDAACHADIVRPGYALYGGCGMEAVVQWSAPLLQVRTLPEGQSVGYGALWRASAPTRVATVEVGYSEGFSRALSNGRGRVFIKGHPAPVIGRVSMDLITLDVTHLPETEVQPGVAVEILGLRQTLDQLAEAAGTIGYDILTGLTPREGKAYRE